MNRTTRTEWRVSLAVRFAFGLEPEVVLSAPWQDLGRETWWPKFCWSPAAWGTDCRDSTPIARSVELQ